MVHPSTKKTGYTARMVSNGAINFNDMVAEACTNTTLNKSEAKMAFEVCIDSIVRNLKKGFIVDLGPVGKLYPSCSSGFVENAEDLTLSKVRPSLVFRPGKELAQAVRGASLQWEDGRGDEN